MRIKKQKYDKTTIRLKKLADKNKNHNFNGVDSSVTNGRMNTIIVRGVDNSNSRDFDGHGMDTSFRQWKFISDTIFGLRSYRIKMNGVGELYLELCEEKLNSEHSKITYKNK